MLVAILVGATAICGVIPNALGVPVPTTSDPSAGLIVSFDFTNPLQTPPPPYEYIFGQFFFVGFDTGDAMEMDVFEDLAGGGFVHTVTGVGSPSGILWGRGGPSDGQFSFGLRMTSGAVDYSAGYAVGATATGVPLTPYLEGRIAGIPEPATLALLSLGLIGVAASHRRRLN